MDIVSDTYQLLVEAVRTALAARGFETSTEHHHSRSDGPAYRLFTRDDHAVCLSWHAAHQAFRLECCRRAAGSPVGVWAMVCEERFDPSGSQPSDVDQIVERICAKLDAYVLT